MLGVGTGLLLKLLSYSSFISLWTPEHDWHVPFKIFLNFYVNVFLVGRCNIALISAIYQHESILPYINMNPPSWTSLPPLTPSHPSRVSQRTGFELPAAYREFPLALCFTYGNLYMFQCFSLISSYPLLPSLCPQVCSLCLCLHCCPENSVALH